MNTQTNIQLLGGLTGNKQECDYHTVNSIDNNYENKCYCPNRESNGILMSKLWPGPS